MSRGGLQHRLLNKNVEESLRTAGTSSTVPVGCLIEGPPQLSPCRPSATPTSSQSTSDASAPLRPRTTVDAGQAVGGRPEPSADLLRQFDDDPLRAADIAQPIAVLVALHSPTSALLHQPALAAHRRPAAHQHDRPVPVGHRGPPGYPPGPTRLAHPHRSVGAPPRAVPRPAAPRRPSRPHLAAVGPSTADKRRHCRVARRRGPHHRRAPARLVAHHHPDRAVPDRGAAHWREPDLAVTR